MTRTCMELMIMEAVATSARKNTRRRNGRCIRSREEWFIPYKQDQRMFNDEPWRRNGKRKGKRAT